MTNELKEMKLILNAQIEQKKLHIKELRKEIEKLQNIIKKSK